MEFLKLLGLSCLFQLNSYFDLGGPLLRKPTHLSCRVCCIAMYYNKREYNYCTQYIDDCKEELKSKPLVPNFKYV